MRTSKIVFFFLFLTGISASAQKADQYNAWIFYTGNHKLTEKWGIHTDYQFRRSDWFSNWQQSQIRVGIDYSFSKTFMVTGGYSYIDTWAYGDFAEEATPKYNHYRFGENRAWQQLLTRQTIGRFSTSTRLRTEQRWIEHKAFDSASGGYVQDEIQYKNRVRFRYQIQFPLNKKEMTDNTLFLQWSDEIFLNWGEGVKANMLDQNRMYMALGWRFNHHCNVQLGYMNQFIEKSDGVHKENNHTLQVSLTYNLDFSKKKEH